MLENSAATRRTFELSFIFFACEKESFYCRMSTLGSVYNSVQSDVASAVAHSPQCQAASRSRWDVHSSLSPVQFAADQHHQRHKNERFDTGHLSSNRWGVRQTRSDCVRLRQTTSPELGLRMGPSQPVALTVVPPSLRCTSECVCSTPALIQEHTMSCMPIYKVIQEVFISVRNGRICIRT